MKPLLSAGFRLFGKAERIALLSLAAAMGTLLVTSPPAYPGAEEGPSLSPTALGVDTASDLLGWWRLDDVTGTLAPDSSGNGFDGIAYGGALSEPVPIGTGQALYFDGVDDVIEVPGIADQINGAQALTVALWVRSDLTGTDRGFISGGEPGHNDNALSFRYDKAGQFGGGENLIRAGVGMWRKGVESESHVQDTEWQHLAMTWVRGSPAEIWLNGQRLASAATGDPWNKPLEGLTTLLIGQGRKNAGSWQGWLRDVRLYRRALTAADLGALANPDWIHVDPFGEGIEIVSGDSQGPEDGHFTERPLILRVVDEIGRPVEGETVTWSTAAGPLLSVDGVQSAAAVQGVTDYNGLARIWVRQPFGNQEPFTVEAATAWSSAPLVFTVRPWGLIGRWRFDEVQGNIVRDSSGSGFDGQLEGGATIEEVAVGSGYGLRLDGVDDWMEAPGSPRR